MLHTYDFNVGEMFKLNFVFRINLITDFNGRRASFKVQRLLQLTHISVSRILEFNQNVMHRLLDIFFKWNDVVNKIDIFISYQYFDVTSWIFRLCCIRVKYQFK